MFPLPRPSNSFFFLVGSVRAECCLVFGRKPHFSCDRQDCSPHSQTVSLLYTSKRSGTLLPSLMIRGSLALSPVFLSSLSNCAPLLPFPALSSETVVASFAHREVVTGTDAHVCAAN